MAAVVAHAVFRPPLTNLELRLEAGVFVIAGRVADGTAEFVKLCAGVERPIRGTLRVDDRDPYTTPDLRRRIGALLPDEELAPGATVRAVVQRSLTLRSAPTSAQAVLDPLGLGHWAERATPELTREEKRAIALALALAHPSPSVLALHEPLAVTPAGQRRHVLERIAGAAQAGAVVVCATESSADAAELASARDPITPVLLGLRDGRLAQPFDRGTLGWRADPRPTFVVRCADPRALAAVLGVDPAITGCDWDLERFPGELCVSGTDADATVLALLRARQQTGISISAVARREAWR